MLRRYKSLIYYYLSKNLISRPSVIFTIVMVFCQIMKIEDHNAGRQDVVQNPGSQCGSTRGRYLSGKAVKWRQRFPTVFQNGRIISSMSVARQRRMETFQVAQEIHGGSAESSIPRAIGLLNTALVRCSPAILVEGLSASKKFKTSVMPTIYKKALTDYEASDEI
jgi:hypothetical protein